ncbi:helix-turn-helix domain-containing protein [Actinophytocola gossypii]|uniref:Helix-turn-helix domain-containing protein n=1 Tax=Actinophytocola gossypii TaxID=2812003 RepID=A0ABT2J4J2_9PSEU|nr:helix-turn-helix domain-containing protein [Actinophytocola gossypii]MCT2582787.1 helix-turn-helix domain-containing protein [Actinophytocola gossypii]
MLETVAVVLMDDVTPFEFGVLCEVFGIDRTEDGVPRVDFLVCGEEPGMPLRTSVGARLTPEYGLDAVARADLVAVTGVKLRDEDQYPVAVLEVLRAAVARGATVLSVCSGAFVLGAAGLLDGRRCTTHWRYVDQLAERHPDALLDPDVLFVDDGNVITSAGTAAGIDACLHLVRREQGSAAANAIARRMVVPPQRDGGQRQYIELPIPECTADSLSPVLAWMLDNLAIDHTVAALAGRARMSERTFARRFVAETGTTPHRWLTMQRVLHARRLLEDTRLPVEDIAARCGFGSAALLRHHFNRVVGVAPKDYRRTFGAVHSGPELERSSSGAQQNR